MVVTLDRMCQGGIYDHVGGGFARYSTDAVWLVPHFEKMLYDNALLIELLTDAWRDSKSPLYAARIRETIDWIAREMITENGAFAASLDADSEGDEGKFYVWSEAEIDAVLGPSASTFKLAYGVTTGGNWDGKTILNRSGRPKFLDDSNEKDLAVSRTFLQRERDKRTRPSWDDKVLADWNGLMIAALAQASMAFDEGTWLALAETAFQAIVRDMSIDGRLRHSYRAGQAKHSAILDDYSNMIRAAISLYEATFKPTYLAAAEGWIVSVEIHYRDHNNGGYFYSADDAEALITRTRTVADSAIPAGNGVMLHVLAKLFHLTGNDRYRADATALLRAFAAEAHSNVLAVPTLLNAFDLLTNATQVVIIGRPQLDATQDLTRQVFRASVPNLAFLKLETTDELPPTHPAAGKMQIDDQPTAYVCKGTVCSQPIVGVDELGEALSQTSLRGFQGQ